MHLTNFPILQEIKNLYKKLRQEGNDRANTVQILLNNYSAEISRGTCDDGLLFWVGLADAQYACKELSGEVAQNALIAIGQLEKGNWPIAANDLAVRRSRYEKPPMPEQRIKKPSAKFRCEWRIGDTFAYQVKGKEALELGICDEFFLFRKVDSIEFGDGRLLPVVTVSFSGTSMVPKNSQEFLHFPMLKLESARFCTPKDKFEYRAEILFTNKRQIMSLPLHYLGNFPNVTMPHDEIVFENPGDIMMIMPKTIDHDCCLFWKMNQYYSSQ